MEETREIEKRTIILIIIILSILIHILFLLVVFKYEPESKFLLDNQIIDEPKENLIQYKQIDTPNTEPEPAPVPVQENKGGQEQDLIQNDLDLPNIRAKKGIPSFMQELDEQIESEPNLTKEAIEPAQKSISEEIKEESKIEEKVEAKSINQTQSEDNGPNTTLKIGNDFSRGISEGQFQSYDAQNLESQTLGKRKTIKQMFASQNKPVLPKKVVVGILEGSENGEHLFDVISLGKENGGNFKLVSYLDKVHATIYNAWNIKQSKLKPKNKVLHIGISLTLNKKGDIVSLNKIRSTGDLHVDDVVMETLRYAEPYPPIPKHLNKEEYVLNETFIITPRKF